MNTSYFYVRKNGDFRLLQIFPEVQLKWCVSPKTDSLIEGTLTGPWETLTYKDCEKS